MSAAASSEVVVIGAGVLGTAVAYFLAREGVDVTVIDRNALGSGASMHGTGMVQRLVWNHPTQYRLAMEGRDLLFQVVPQMRELTGIDPRLHTFPTIVPIYSERTASVLERDVEVSGGDIELRWLDPDEALRIEPRLNPALERAALLEGDAQVDGYRLTLAQASAAEKFGTQFLTRQATGIQVEGGRVTGVRHPGGVIPCGIVVIAMGAWSGEASDWLGFPVPIKPLKGETLRVRYPDPVPHQVWGACSPRKDGLLSLGATGANRFSDMPDDLVRLDFDTRGTPQGRDYMLAKALAVMPDLERAEVVDHLAGPRPLSADGMPIMGPVPGVKGAFVATGHRNKGIHLSAITAKIVSDFIFDGEAQVSTPLDMFLPERFARFQGREVEFHVPGVTE